MPPKKVGKDFQWTDDEAELLLTVTEKQVCRHSGTDEK